MCLQLEALALVDRQAFGMTVARPGSAHIGYDKDERVVALIAKGIGTSHTSPLVMERCEYTPTIE